MLSTSTAQRALMRRPMLLATLALGAVVAICGSVALVRSSTSMLEENYDLPDGVQPVDKLAFSQALKVHERSAKKLDDVASRSRTNISAFAIH